MSNATEDQIRSIIRDVLGRLPAETVGGGGGAKGGGSYAPQQIHRGTSIPTIDTGLGVFETMDEAIRAAHAAWPHFRNLTMEKRKEIVAAIRAATIEGAEKWAAATVEETGMGRVDYKIAKHHIISKLTPGPEIIEPRVFTGDRGLTLVDYAPFGVVGAITPSTHPVPTLVCNAIGFLSGGNTGAFNPHPASKRVFADAVQTFNRVIQAHGGPPNTITTVIEPTIDTGRELFTHENVRLLLVTGGPAVVGEALKAPKRAICAGPGNPPVVVDATADIEVAAREITEGASFDYNVLCTAEKEIFVVEKVADELINAMRRKGCVLLERHDVDRLAREAFQLTGGVLSCAGARLNRDLVGRSAATLASSIGLRVDADTPLLIGEVPAEHAFVMEEQIMPFMPITRVRDADEGIARAAEAEGRRNHTASIFSNCVKVMSKMARELECSIFVKNGPTYAGLGHGGEGYTSFSIATPTGEGLTTARTFCRERRCTMVDKFRIV